MEDDGSRPIERLMDPHSPDSPYHPQPGITRWSASAEIAAMIARARTATKSDQPIKVRTDKMKGIGPMGANGDGKVGIGRMGRETRVYRGWAKPHKPAKWSVAEQNTRRGIKRQMKKLKEMGIDLNKLLNVNRQK